MLARSTAANQIFSCTWELHHAICTGATCVNIHTTTSPAGEIRCQIEAGY
jgi:hypothetical protein